jgi:hypothetical protein
VQNDKIAIAVLVQFPVLTTLAGNKVRLGRNVFMSHYAEIFNGKVLATIAAARFKSLHDYSCVFWNGHGMMLGDGEVWFDMTANGVKIVTINN